MVPLLTAVLHAQDRTVGVLLNSPKASPGYTLFAPLISKTTWLIDLEGRVINRWESDYLPGSSVYLLEDGGLLRCGVVGGTAGEFGVAGGSGGIVQEFDWEGNLSWEYSFANDSLRQHHDAIRLPSGNLLIILWELVPEDVAVAHGRDPATIPDGGIWVDMLMEIMPVGAAGAEVVWEWHALDHLVQDYDNSKMNAGRITDHPERIDFNRTGPGQPKADWLHINAVAYNEEFDQVLITSPFLNEILIIDHSTSTDEAAGSTGGIAGRGGDILYRWGNPEVYGADGEQQLFFQHNAHWIPDGSPGGGNIMIFNNGRGRPDGEWSSVVEIVPPVLQDGTYRRDPGSPFAPSEPTWSYAAPDPTTFYSSMISGAHRLPNGNTLICSGMEGRFFEVTSEGEVVWEYRSPVLAGRILEQGNKPGAAANFVFRAERYAPDHPAFVGRDITPGDFIERYPSSLKDIPDTPEELDIE